MLFDDNLPKCPGTYILILKLPAPKEITIGALGKQNFKKGYYAYIGSAMGPGGLKARLKHHLYSMAEPHWHIDYLKACGKIVEVWYATGKKRLECNWANDITVSLLGQQPVTGFGASDCHCVSHLFYFPRKSLIHEAMMRIEADANICHVSISRILSNL